MVFLFHETKCNQTDNYTQGSTPNFVSSEFKRIILLLFPLKSSENLWFSDDFRGIGVN